MQNKKVVIVSGGSRGIGKGIVEYLLGKGYIVAAFSRSQTEYVQNLIDKDQDSNFFYWSSLDLGDRKALKKFVFDVYGKYKKIDALVNNAGINLDKLLAVTTDEDIHKILMINLESLIILTRYVTRFMMINNSGAILNISSIIGHRGYKGTSVYAASKAAMVGLTKSLARELGSRNIRVNALLPGFIKTQMTAGIPEARKNQIIRRTPLGRLGGIDDITGLVEVLLSDKAGFITGQSLVIDGGLTC